MYTDVQSHPFLDTIHYACRGQSCRERNGGVERWWLKSHQQLQVEQVLWGVKSQIPHLAEHLLEPELWWVMRKTRASGVPSCSSVSKGGLGSWSHWTGRQWGVDSGEPWAVCVGPHFLWVMGPGPLQVKPEPRASCHPLRPEEASVSGEPNMARQLWLYHAAWEGGRSWSPSQCPADWEGQTCMAHLIPDGADSRLWFGS